MSNRTEAQSTIQALHDAITGAGHTTESIAELIGVPTSELTLEQPADIPAHLVSEILHALNVDPSRFFEGVAA